METINKSLTKHLANIATILNNDPRLNSNYLKHYLSNVIQEDIATVNLRNFELNILFPGWTTCDEEEDRKGGRYHFNQKEKRFYKSNRGKAGTVDFAIGKFPEPDIGVELSLNHGWENELVIYDYMKLLDPENPFSTVYSLSFILRKKNLVTGKDYHYLKEKINETLSIVKSRLDSDIDNDREFLFIITEVSNVMLQSNYNQRRHWCLHSKASEWLEGEDIEELLLKTRQNSQLKLF